MRSSKYTEHYTDTFITFKEIMRTVSNIYHNCVPDKIKNRRNTDQLKQRDTVIIACVIWGIINGYTSQRATYRGYFFIKKPNGDFPSRSRFTRLSSNLAYTIKIIRYFFIKKLTKGELVGIIDSFPSPLCKPVVTKTGFPITYSITNPGVHDVKVLETLSEEANLLLRLAFQLLTQSRIQVSMT
ncbi:hypothetical protein EfmAA818_29310 (plasmid) [Enterococcus faecium]|nr:hypothetical protein EfmAA818_29310 [Enterococcus faecium]